MANVPCTFAGCDYTQESDTVANAVLLLQIHAIAHQQASAPQPTQPPTATSSSIVKKPDRPSIDLNSSEAQYEFFKDEWRIYKLRANVTSDNDKRLVLRAACCLQAHEYQTENDY